MTNNPQVSDYIRQVNPANIVNPTKPPFLYVLPRCAVLRQALKGTQ